MGEGNVEAQLTTVDHGFTQIREGWAVGPQARLSQTSLLSALRQTQLEHGKDLAGLKNDMAGLKGDMAGLVQGQRTIISMVEQLIARRAVTS